MVLQADRFETGQGTEGVVYSLENFDESAMSGDDSGETDELPETVGSEDESEDGGADLFVVVAVDGLDDDVDDDGCTGE